MGVNFLHIDRFFLRLMFIRRRIASHISQFNHNQTRIRTNKVVEGTSVMPMAHEKITGETSLAEEALPIGTTLLGDQFTITGRIGAGGFGITYRAKDNVLGRTIVIKECFPEDICGRKGLSVRPRSRNFAKPMRAIVDMFMREARSLAQLRHPNIVGVHRAFEENETAYMVLDLIEGRDLFDILEANAKRLSPARVTDILLQLLDAVEEVHKLGLLHRDISPDNILIEKAGMPVLIDFGAARADSSRHTRAVSGFMVVKDGYSPQEFYVAGGEQSPSSDLYALAATFYHLLTGEAPANSQTRIMQIASGRPDPCVALAGRIPGYDQAFLEAIDKAMSIHPDDRLQTAAKWRSLIEDVAVEDVSKPKTKPRSVGKEIPLDLELSLAQLVEETNEEVLKSSEAVVEAEPVVTPRKETSQRAWIEEFNRETLSRPPTREQSKDMDGGLSAPVFDEDDTTSRDGPGHPYLSRTPSFSEANWVERALEKRHRIRSDPQNQPVRIEAASDARANSRSSRSVSEEADLWDESAVAALHGTRPRIRALDVIAGLIVSFCLVAVLNAIDGKQPQEPSKPTAGPFEMRGSIIR